MPSALLTASQAQGEQCVPGGDAARGGRACRQLVLCRSQMDGQRTAFGGKPRSVTVRNMLELLNLLFIIVQHRKVSGKGKRKYTSLHL